MSCGCANYKKLSNENAKLRKIIKQQNKIINTMEECLFDKEIVIEGLVERANKAEEKVRKLGGYNHGSKK